MSPPRGNPLARDRDNRMRPPGFTRVVEHKPWGSPGRLTRADGGVPKGQRTRFDGPFKEIV